MPSKPVSVRYEDGHPVSVDTVLLSTQHDPEVTQEQLHRDIRKEVIVPVLQDLLREDTRILINTTALNVCLKYLQNKNCISWIAPPSTVRHDYCLTTILSKTGKASSPSVFNSFRKVQRNRMFSPKTVQPLKTQHFIRMRLKTPTHKVAGSNPVGRTKMPWNRAISRRFYINWSNFLLWDIVQLDGAFSWTNKGLPLIFLIFFCQHPEIVFLFCLFQRGQFLFRALCFLILSAVLFFFIGFLFSDTP